jgi:hypothetical protein
MLFTGARVRAATNEPVPDPKSPGLNLGQVDTALYRLSKGAIDLDTHHRYDFDATRSRIIAGQPAVVQIRRKVMVDRGYADGNYFGGGHAAAAGYDTALWVDDPLTGLFRPGWDDLDAAMGGLVLNAAGDIAGSGKGYVSFGRDVVPSYRIRFAPGPATFRYTLRDGLVWSRQPVRFKAPTNAPCRPVRLFGTHPRGPLKGTPSRRLAVITAGYLKGQGFAEKLPTVDVFEV